MPVLVKICGITNVEDAVAAAEFGADFIGLNFYPGSPRCVSEGQARLILQTKPRTSPVGLFVNESWERIRDVTARLGLIFVQVHGDHIEPCPFPNLSWIPAFGVVDASSFMNIGKLIEAATAGHGPLAVLVDAHVPGSFGGTGRRAPWQLLGECVSPFPEGSSLNVYRWLPNVPSPIQLILAGGLTPDNVADAIRIVRPWAVDVASGVEASPGKKDHDQMRRFIENAKAAG